MYSAAGFVTLLVLSFYTSNAIARPLYHFSKPNWTKFSISWSKIEKELSYLAHHDSLTGLYNRTALKESFSAIQTRNIQNGTKIAVLFIDLDDF